MSRLIGICICTGLAILGMIYAGVMMIKELINNNKRKD